MLFQQIIEGNDDKTRLLTGLPSHEAFLSMFDCLEKTGLQDGVLVLQGACIARQVAAEVLHLLLSSLLCRLRLCQGVNIEFVAILFHVHETTIGHIFRTWILSLSLELFDLFPYPSKDEIKQVDATAVLPLSKPRMHR